MANGVEILFVDDEESIRLTLPMLLQDFGFRVTAVGTVAEALRLIGERQFDVLISDLNISRPGDGFALINAMRNTQPNAVRFLLTGYPDFDSALNALREEVDNYLIKPTEIEDIVSRIRSKLEKSPKRKQQTHAMPLSGIIRREQEYIIGKWLKLAKADAELSRIKLSDGQRTDHLPEVLALAVGVLEGEQLAPEDRLAAAQHGRTRFNQRYLAT